MASQLDNFSTLADWNVPLRIQRRGNFLSDDGFLDYRRHFETAATDLLQEFDLGKNEDVFRSYRRLRDHQLSGTDRTAKVAEESDKFKIVMDVEGFTDGDLQVKVSGPNEIVVEGLQEVKNGGGTFSSHRSFRRRFSLPGLAMVQDASSVVSSDNVLTVNIPKKIQEITNESTSSSINQQKHQQNQQMQQQLLQQQQQQQQQQTETIESKIKESLQRFNKDSTSGFTSDNIWDLQIVPRKSFFDDSFFENVRSNFQKSVEEVVEKRNQNVRSTADVGLLSKVRQTREDNIQATSVTEDAKEYKIVLDAHGYSEGDLKVRAVSECELIVEGKVEKKTEYTSCTHNFNKKFSLPSSVCIREATSALSSEGILTIIVPKRLEAIDYAIPVRSEAASLVSNIIKKEQERETNSMSSVTNQKENLFEKKVTESRNQKEHFVPINLEEGQITNISEQRKNTTYEVTEPSQVVKESQKLVSESTKLMKDISSSERNVTNEHFVPVELEAGITVNTNANTQSSNVKQQSSNLTKNISSTTDTSKMSTQQQSSNIFQQKPSSERIIPISLKGSFYNESIFDDTRKSIDKEVQNVFTKYRQTSVIDENKESSDVQKVTQETASLSQNGQTTSTILDDAHSYKIVLDVMGFEEKELSIRVSGVSEITIEGNSEKKKGGSIAKHSFQRTFQLPGYVDLERTFTALSEEGILTVTVPKKNQLVLLDKRDASPASSKRENRSVNKSQEVKTTMVIDSSGIVQENKSEKSSVCENTGNLSQRMDSETSTQNISSVPSSNQTTHQTLTSEGHREHIVPLCIDEISDVASEAGSIQSTSNLTSQMSNISNTSKDVSQDILSTSTSATSMDSQIQNNDKVIQVQNLNTDFDRNMSTVSNFNNQTKDIMTRTLFDLPIVSRGHFFDDSFFQDSRPMFESILRNKMNRFNRSTSFVDDLGFFKSLRENKFTSGNQVANLSEDDQFNKIVLDVQGFNENNLKVKALSENEILVEGEEEEKTGNSFSKRTFRKHFVLPGAVNLRGATSNLSSDGVLNITIPKC